MTQTISLINVERMLEKILSSSVVSSVGQRGCLEGRMGVRELSVQTRLLMYDQMI